MTYQDLPSRQKSQRLINRLKTQQSQQHFQQYKLRSKNITNINELLPGLNDISDAFEALPLDLIKYSTLLKEIDAKCINTVPQINYLIEKYIDTLHQPAPEADTTAAAATGKTTAPANGNANGTASGTTNGTANGTAKTTTPNVTKTPPTPHDLEYKRLALIKDKINEIIPCLEEKMHVTSVATELLNKHMFRINNDYKLIINNNEIPESIRIGPLNHPAMIMDSSSSAMASSADRSAQSQRSESRREALAAKKAGKEDVADDIGGAKKKRTKEMTPLEAPRSTTHSGSGSNAASTKKRPRKEAGDDIPRPVTPGAIGASAGTGALAAKKKSKPRRDDDIKSNNTSDGEGRQEGRVRGDTHPGAGGKSGSSEPTYCYCNQVSFGEMVGCDGDDCKREWFHLPCIGFKNPPKGKWYCDDCLVKMKKIRKV
ncbi:uncharacterized protein CANTADRAFT_4411 [Suhomyces tanzawaensis NRRL Y-17324]|uniref:Chromatin modification-related protein n=1 Tax=Suhomyces tanzawaensis NRRL Y-17324 TaxID=984487 RepID=A0A1E4SSC6_9ASCO|nr:uncharacterized protein CANTADRAFT_4411 [Suhomyces tanzawaensis NRRL Y-17324]ODV82416.1 hypothetical protein CANTADRAFT_4411 [Suhomyces tanzawaensis NRRL Y-17324]